MYVILTSKQGQFTTQGGDGVRAMAAYDYLFCGRKTAHFVIAELLDDTARVRIVEEDGASVNNVPVKLLPKFETVERAVAELETLTAFGKVDAVLRPVPLPVP